MSSPTRRRDDDPHPGGPSKSLSSIVGLLRKRPDENVEPVVLYEDNHLLVVNKPPGWATMGDTEAPSVHRWGCQYLRQRYSKPGKVFLGIVSRLDKPTTGVLVLARTSKAASRLSAQFAAKDSGQVQKLYRAIVESSAAGGHTASSSRAIPSSRSIENQTAFSDGVWSDWVVKDEAAKRMRCVPADFPQAKSALSNVHFLREDPPYRELQVELITGRKHQIRLQAAERGMPIVGEFKYASGAPGNRLLLHSYRLTIEHPTKREPLTFTATPPWE